LPQLVEQPRILDGDDGLTREVLDQHDLLVGEWPDFLPVDDDSADQQIILEHWNVNCGSRAAECCCLAGCGIGGLVGSVPHLLCPRNLIQVAARRSLKRSALLLEFGKFRRRAELRCQVVRIAVEAEQGAELGLANAGRIRQHGLEDRFQLAR
jgi:hypothetical protein